MNYPSSLSRSNTLRMGMISTPSVLALSLFSALYGMAILLKPRRLLSWMRMSMPVTARHSPERPISPNAIRSSRTGRSRSVEISASVKRLGLIVEQDAPGASPLGLAFRSVGGSAWLYALVMLVPLLYLGIIVLMFVIIHSLRRSIREERTLDKRNVWYLRTIGLLTILAELISDTVNWAMNSRAAELLAGSGYTVNTEFRISYAMIIMGILILFAAEVFAVGQNLSEEQKYTI